MNQKLNPTHLTKRIARRAALLLSAVLSMALPLTVHAQAYPSKAIHIIVPFPAGSSGDVTARQTGQILSTRMGQPVVIENRPGAGDSGQFVMHRRNIHRPKPASRQSLCRDDGYVLSCSLESLSICDFCEGFGVKWAKHEPNLAQACSSRHEIRSFSQRAPRFAGVPQGIKFP